jgi:hypothetical protein
MDVSGTYVMHGETRQACKLWLESLYVNWNTTNERQMLKLYVTE